MRPLLLILCALFANECLACSCVKGANIAHMEEAAERVVLADLKRGGFSSIGNRKYVFAVRRSLKGSGTDRVVVSTSRFGTACGLKAERNVTYVLFVHRENGKLMVDRCSSWPLTAEYARYTAALNDFYELTGADALKPSP